MRILVATGESELRKELRDRLKAEGHSVAVAKDGLGALSLMSAYGYGLLIVDLAMPCLNGRELMEDIKRRGLVQPLIVISDQKKDQDEFEKFWHKKSGFNKLIEVISTITPKALKPKRRRGKFKDVVG